MPSSPPIEVLARQPVGGPHRRPPGPLSTSYTQQGSQAAPTSQGSSGAETRAAQRSRSTSQQHQASSPQSTPTNAPSQSSSQASISKLTGGQRFFFAFIACIFAFVAVVGFWVSPPSGVGVFAFLLATALLFAVACLYQRQVSRIFLLLHVRRQLWATIGVIVLVLLIGKIVYLRSDAHSENQVSPTTSSQISKVKIINGSLSDTTVSGHSNERYPVAYNFTGYIQNNSTASISFIRMKIRIFDCPGMKSASSSVSYGITYQAGVFDPSPPSNCKGIGEEEEDDFPNAEPGQTLGFANFYFPNHPQGGLRWNYEITKMDTQAAAASVPVQPALDVRKSEQPSQSSPAQRFAVNSKQVKVTQPRLVSQAAQQPSQQDNAPGPDQTVASVAALSGPIQKSQARSPSATDDLSNLSASDRNSVESACSGARLVQGAAAYHRCLNTQLQELGQYPDTPNLSRLNTVDRASIESACSGARLVQGAAAYHRCLTTQLQELARYPDTPDLKGLSSVDRNSIESACSGARLVQGPASYHQCLKRQLSELRGQ